MIVFIENLAGLHIASHAPGLKQCWSIKIVRRDILQFMTPALRGHGPVVALPAQALRVLKPALSALQMPVVLQDPNCLAFRLGHRKEILSDGLLTEYLVEVLGVPVRRLHSILSAADMKAGSVPGCAIVGSNWLEFGSMSEASYRRHLEFLQRTYPDAIYYCHPKERNGWPEVVFGAAQVGRADRPLEAHLRSAGIPSRLVGVCSSSLLSLAAGGERIQVDLVRVPLSQFDGMRGEQVEVLKHPIRGVDAVNVRDLQDFLERKLTISGAAVNVVLQR